VFEHRPDLLIVSYGLNDARGGTPLAQFAEDLSILVGRVRDNCAPLIVLPGPYFMTDFSVGGQVWSHADLRLFEQFNRQIASVADTLDCLFVDLLAGYDRTPWLVHHDGVHANDLGHLVVAHRIFEKLLQNCSGLARNTQALEESIPPWRDESTLQADYGH
jgi:lysophospholipase L1-like esterase